MQVFVRNREGKVWGPIEPQSVQLLAEGGVLQPPFEVSLNGLDFTTPELVPEFSDVVPKEVWSAAAAQKPKFAPPVLSPVDTPAGGAPPATPKPDGRRAATNPATGSAPPSIAPAVSATAVPPSLAAIPDTGDLASLSPIKLYGLAASTDTTALFTFKLSDRSIEVHFRKGNPERVESSHPEDSLATFVQKHGMASSDKVAQAEKEKARFGGELVAALFGLGILNPGSAFAQLGQRANAILASALFVSQGRFTFHAIDLPPHQSMPLGNRWAVLSDAVRRMPLTEISKRARDVWTNPVMRAEGVVAAADLKLNATETRALSRIDGVRSLEELCRDFGAEGDIFQRLVFFLRELDLVSFAPPKAASSPSPPKPAPAPAPAPAPPQAAAAAPRVASAPSPAAKAKAPAAAAKQASAPAAPKPAAAPAPPPVAVSPAVELKELKLRVEAIKKQNHFEVLSVKDSADSAAVKAAYFKLAKQLHPDTVPADAPPELGELKAEVFAAVNEAYQVLGEDASRAQYISDLKSGGLEKIDVRAILAAEEKFQRACVVFKGRRYADALGLFEECIAANPDEGEFYAWRGYCKFVVATDKKAGAVEAQKDLNESLKRNNRCAPAHYFLGMIAKLAGDPKAARKHFQNAVDLDPHNVDAQRELRMQLKNG